MKGALWVCERDLRKFARQPFIMGSALLGPFLMLVLLGYAFGGSITHVPVGVVRYSQGRYSTAFLDILNIELDVQNKENALRLRNFPDIDSARNLLEKGGLKAIIYLESSFDSSLERGNTGIVTVYLDNTDPLSAQSVTAALARAGQLLSSQLLVVSINTEKLTVDFRNYYRKVEYIEFMAPGSIVQAIFIASIIGGGISILFDKQRGVIEGYLVTPLRQYEIVVGVLLAGVIKAMFSSLAMFSLAIIVAGVRPMVDVFGFLLMLFTMFLTALGLISMMTAFAVRAPAPEVYQFTAFPINMILYFTSGAIYPLEGFPVWMKSISAVNPEAYAVHAMRMIMYKHATFWVVAGDLAFLAVFTTIMCVIATMAFKRAL